MLYVAETRVTFKQLAILYVEAISRQANILQDEPQTSNGRKI